MGRRSPESTRRTGRGSGSPWTSSSWRHELPEYWAYGLYYGQDGRGRSPVGDPVADADIDFATLPVRPAPPKDSPFWTVDERELKVLGELAESP
ncbi:hypothetical protein ACWGKA_00275 [Streptomyces luteogriseus]